MRIHCSGPASAAAVNIVCSELQSSLRYNNIQQVHFPKPWHRNKMCTDTDNRMNCDSWTEFNGNSPLQRTVYLGIYCIRAVQRDDV